VVSSPVLSLGIGGGINQVVLRQDALDYRRVFAPTAANGYRQAHPVVTAPPDEPLSQASRRGAGDSAPRGRVAALGPRLDHLTARTEHLEEIADRLLIPAPPPTPQQVNYSAAKAAVTGMTRTLAKEWGRYAVTVNCVAFGYIQTRLTKPLAEG
jgi:NAD(P)-dependent dehydrogenase (short-subunit alcohol dehydrogenase family)